MPKVELHTRRRKFSVPVNGITTEGREAVRNLIENMGLPELPRNWSWDWNVTGRGMYVGSFPKRVAKYMYTCGAKLPKDRIARIGSLAAEHCQRTSDYLLRFTQSFDWAPGDFADYNSCYWTCHSHARVMLAEHDAWAILFYNTKPPHNGIARAWVVPMGGDRFVVYNGYGYTTLQIARMLGHYWGLYYRHIVLLNHGMCDGTLYINGNGSGYVVGDQQWARSTTSVDFGWSDGTARCHECGDHGPEDSYFSVVGRDYCRPCYRDNFRFCYRCEGRFSIRDVHSVDGVFYCDACVPQSTRVCLECGVTCSIEYLTAVPTGRFRCMACQQELAGV
jgi:hypothetical protein